MNLILKLCVGLSLCCSAVATAQVPNRRDPLLESLNGLTIEPVERLGVGDWVAPTIEATFVDDNQQVFQPDQVTAVFKVTRTDANRLWTGEAWVDRQQVLSVNKAAQHYTSLINGGSTATAEVYRRRAETYRHHGELLFALLDFNQAIAMQPVNPLALAGRAKVYRQQASFDLAKSDLEAALQLRKDDVDLLIELGCVYSEKGDTAQAMNACQNALRLNPNSALALRWLAGELNKQGKYQEAIEHYNRSIAIDRNDDVIVERVETLLAQQKTKEAEDELNALLKTSPRHGRAWTILGVIQIGMNRFKDASKSFKEATSWDSDNPVVWHNLGMLRWRYNDHEEALNDMRHALMRDRNYLPSLMAISRIFSSAPEPSLRSPELAILFGLHALDVSRHENAIAYATVAAAYAANGSFDEAIRYQERAVTLQNSQAGKSQPVVGLDADRLQSDLEMYRKSKPTRLEPIITYER